MKFYCRTDHFKNRLGFTIKNDALNNVYKVKGSFFHGLKLLTFKDWSDEEMYRVKKTFAFGLKSTYVLTGASRQDIQAYIIRNLANKGMLVTFPSGEIYQVKTDGSAVEFIKDQEQVVSLEAKEGTPDRLYEITLRDDRKPLLNLACIIAVKQILLGRRKRSE